MARCARSRARTPQPAEGRRRRPEEVPLRRRPYALALLAVALWQLVSIPTAAALTRVTYEVAPLVYTYREGEVCPMALQLVERDGHTVTSTYDGDAIVRTVISGSVTTEVSSSLGAMTFGSIGTSTVTPNPDGTWTMVQRGSGLAIVPATDPDGPRLVWFTGVVTSVGSWDEKGLVFTATSQVRDGLAANVCEMLVAGLKRRHD